MGNFYINSTFVALKRGLCSIFCSIVFVMIGAGCPGLKLKKAFAELNFVIGKSILCNGGMTARIRVDQITVLLL